MTASSPSNRRSGSGHLSCLPPGDWPPRLLAMLHGPNDPAWGHCPHPVPLTFARTPRFLAPRRSRPRLGLRHRAGTRWGVNGDSDPSGSARQQQTSRRSTGSPRAGSQGEGSLATRRSARADERRPATAPAERSKTRAGRASKRPRTRAPHGEERSEKTEDRTSARTASDRNRRRPGSAVDDGE